MVFIQTGIFLFKLELCFRILMVVLAMLVGHIVAELDLTEPLLVETTYVVPIMDGQ